ncbi:MAG: hypothetical protein ACK4NA_03125 [Alphaproteobacteria bacterium]
MDSYGEAMIARCDQAEEESYSLQRENGIAKARKMADSFKAGHVGRWSTWDYAVAAAYTALLMAPAPFFWAPPAWVWALMNPFPVVGYGDGAIKLPA